MLVCRRSVSRAAKGAYYPDMPTLKPYKLQTKPFLEEKNARKRLQLANEMLELRFLSHKDDVWVDETFLRADCSFNGQNYRAYATTRDEANKIWSNRGHRGLRKFPPGIHLAVAASPRGVPRLFHLPDSLTWTSEVMTTRFYPFLKQELTKLYGDEFNEKVRLWQDNASAHTANRSQDYLKGSEWGADFYPKQLTMSKSPDLNYCENLIALLEHQFYSVDAIGKIYPASPEGRKQMRKDADRAWKRIWKGENGRRLLLRYDGSVDSRLRAIVKAKGWQSEY